MKKKKYRNRIILSAIALLFINAFVVTPILHSHKCPAETTNETSHIESNCCHTPDTSQELPADCTHCINSSLDLKAASLSNRSLRLPAKQLIPQPLRQHFVHQIQKQFNPPIPNGLTDTYPPNIATIKTIQLLI